MESIVFVFCFFFGFVSSLERERWRNESERKGRLREFIYARERKETGTVSSKSFVLI
jgi:hypothetical protein